MLNQKEETQPTYTINELCQLFDEQLKSLRPKNKPLRRRHIPESEKKFWDLAERYQIVNLIYDLMEERKAKSVAYAFIFDKDLGMEFNHYCLKK